MDERLIEVLERIEGHLRVLAEEARKPKPQAPSPVLAGPLQCVLCIKGADGVVRPIEADPHTGAVPMSIQSTRERPIWMLDMPDAS